MKNHFFAELPDGRADRRAEFVGVVNPMRAVVGRAGLAGEIRRTGAVENEGFVLLLGDVEHCKGHG